MQYTYMKKFGVNSTNGSNSDPSKPGHSSSGPRVSVNGQSTSVGYNEEEVAIVREIINKRKKEGYYEILGLEKTCSVIDIRKAYRQLSLKVHPDKNQAPGAEEAFKLVSKAYQCLSDAESRKTYDVFGFSEPGGFYERRETDFNDVDADEIFRNFNQEFTSFDFESGGVDVRMVSNFRPSLLQLLLLKIFIKSLCFFFSHLRLIVVAVLLIVGAARLEVITLEVVSIMVVVMAAAKIMLIIILTLLLIEHIMLRLLSSTYTTNDYSSVAVGNAANTYENGAPV